MGKVFDSYFNYLMPLFTNFSILYFPRNVHTTCCSITPVFLVAYFSLAKKRSFTWPWIQLCVRASRLDSPSMEMVFCFPGINSGTVAWVPSPSGTNHPQHSG